MNKQAGKEIERLKGKEEKETEKIVEDREL